MDSLRTPTLLNLLARLIRSAAPARPAAACSAVDAAHASNAALAAITPAICLDTAMSAEDLAGSGSYQPALPFFMQKGFE